MYKSSVVDVEDNKQPPQHCSDLPPMPALGRRSGKRPVPGSPLSRVTSITPEVTASHAGDSHGPRSEPEITLVWKTPIYGMPPSSSTAMAAHAPKKKKIELDMAPDVGQKPIQLQRRRVWRACESCRRKKIKCDGNEPVCSQCAASKSQCTWLQTKDRAALSRHYVQELEARLLHMEDVFKQVAPVIDVLEKTNGVKIPPSVSDAVRQCYLNDIPTTKEINPIVKVKEETASQGSRSATNSPSSKSARVEGDDVSDSFGQLALDEHGHLRWIGGSSTMSLIQSFRALTSSPLHRISPMEEDPHSPGPSATKLYFPASVFFGKVHALPGPEEVEYPERDLADKLVDAYFTRFHFLLPVIDKPSFLASYQHLMDNNTDVPLARQETAFIALVFAVFACAARILEDDRLNNPSSPDDGGMGMIYYERALILHYISHASIQLAHVQSFVLLSSFLCSVNCLPQAWLLIGQAVRLGQDLGLHRYSRHLSLPPIERETRRKVWWGAYCIDRMLALALGRPLGIEDSDCDAEMPVEFDDEDLQEYFSGAQMQRSPPSLMTGFISMIRLYQIAGRVCRQVYSIDNCRENLEPERMEELQRQVAILDKELNDWCEELPPVYKSNSDIPAYVTSGAVLCGHYFSILTTLHRNFLPIRQNKTFGTFSTNKALKSARSSIRLGVTIKNTVPMSHHVSFFIQQLFSAAVILLLYAMHISDDKAARAAMDEVNICMDVISSWDGKWPGTRKCRELLTDLIGTANDAISRGLNSGKPEEPLFPNKVPLPPSPPVFSPADAAKASRIIRNKPRSARKSRDFNVSPRLAAEVAAAAEGPNAFVNKRPHRDIESGRTSPSSYLQQFSSPYSVAASVDSRVSTNSSSTALSADNRGMPPQSFVNPELFNTDSPLSQDNSSQLQFDYHYPSSISTRDFGGPSTWQSSDPIYGSAARPTFASTLSTFNDNAVPPSPADTNFMDTTAMYDPNAMLGQAGSLVDTSMDNMPSSNMFAASGLPFLGLDFIQNYPPGGLGYVDDNKEQYWQSFDAGEFGYDPQLPFTFGEVRQEGPPG